MNPVNWITETEKQYAKLRGIPIATTLIVEQQKQIKLLQELLRQERLNNAKLITKKDKP